LDRRKIHGTGAAEKMRRRGPGESSAAGGCAGGRTAALLFHFRVEFSESPAFPLRILGTIGFAVDCGEVAMHFRASRTDLRRLWKFRPPAAALTEHPG